MAVACRCATMGPMKTRFGNTATKPPKREKFDFEKMKKDATHENSEIRKKTFLEYFERFAEFPSYLFDNEKRLDERLGATINDILKDPETSKDVRKGIDSLLMRLPPTSAA